MPEAQELIEIVNGQVVLKKVITERTVALADFLPQLQTRQRLTMTQVPENMLHIDVRPRAIDTEVDLIIEVPFGTRRISHRAGRAGSNQTVTNYLLDFPWTYFVFKLRTTDANLRRNWSTQDWRVWMTNVRATDLTSRLWPMALHNCYSDGRICFGNLGVSTGLSLRDYIQTTINVFWTGEFNNDVRPPLGLPNGFPDYAAWQTEALVNPMGWQHWTSWQDTSNTTTLASQLNSPDRMAPITIPDTIPSIPMPYTFDRIDAWFSSLDTGAQERVRDHLNGAGRLILRPRT